MKKSYWACQAFGWGLYSVIGVSMAVSQEGWRPSIIAGYALYFLYSIGLTHWLRREIRARQWLSGSFWRVFLRLALAAVGIGAIQACLVVSLGIAFEGIHSLLVSPKFALSVWLSSTYAVGAWAGIYAGLTAKRRHQEKETQLQLALREAELRALEAQINPHFLFNCLNSIRALVVENPPLAQDMITRLANILRYNLHHDLSHTVPLASELAAVSDYLALESVRFEDRLRVRQEIDAEAGRLAIPPMLLQTLVENALKHGIAPSPAGGEIFIQATVEAGALVLKVENTGRLTATPPGSTQLGLSNIRERLRILYGERATLQLKADGSDRVAATVLIPKFT